MINLKKLYDEHPECFESSAKFKAYLIDLYPEEKKARINVLTTMLEEGALKPAQTEDTFDDAAFCKRICDDYGYSENLVRECFVLFVDIYKGQIATMMLQMEELLRKVEVLPRISILKTELGLIDLFCQNEENDSNEFLPYTEEKKAIQALTDAEDILKTAKIKQCAPNLSIMQKTCNELEKIASHFKEVVV